MFDSTRYANSNVSNTQRKKINKKTVMEEGEKRFHTRNFESTRKTLVTFPKTANVDGFWGKNGIIQATVGGSSVVVFAQLFFVAR